MHAAFDFDFTVHFVQRQVGLVAGWRGRHLFDAAEPAQSSRAVPDLIERHSINSPTALRPTREPR
jgi:hypothetical protein